MGQARKFVAERQQWIVADICVCEQRLLLFFCSPLTNVKSQEEQGAFGNFH